MRALWLILSGCLLSAPAAAALYRHVDAAGHVTYSDRPQAPGDEALRLPPPNVATPEARRQMELARLAWEREAREEENARLRQWAAAQRIAPARQAPRYGAPVYPRPVYHVAYARTPAQSYPSQGLRPARFPHRPRNPRR